MSTAGSVYAEGANIHHEKDDDIDIVASVNKTHDSDRDQNNFIADSIEMQHIIKDPQLQKYDGQNHNNVNDAIQITLTHKNIKSFLLVILSILIIYSAIVCTYLLFSKPLCSCTSHASTVEDHLKSKSATSISPTNYPSQSPSKIPSKSPTLQPTQSPSKSPSKYPSLSPSKYPSLSPTHYSGNYIGDYKLSFKNYSHGFWKKCDGSYLSINGAYTLLFDEIGYIFGKYVDNVTNQSYFKLPTVTDTVIGIAGGDHLIGDELFGKESMLLTHSEIPPHRHYTMYNGLCSTEDWGAYSAAQCTAGIGDNLGYAQYLIRGSYAEPNGKISSSYGGGQTFSIMQPTKFIANLFIYTEVFL